jgi:hypothetical protein
MSKGKARIKKIETRRAPSGVKVETYVDLAASKTRFEERIENGRKVLKMILSKDDAGIL